MRLYRICPEPFVENFTGLGGSYKSGGRWNLPGIPVMYFALSASVALLEMANYLPSPRFVPKNYRLAIYELNTDLVDEIDAAELPENWASFPYPHATQQRGSQWLQSCHAAILKVPSAATPGGLEHCVLFNPGHPDSRNMKLVETKKDLFNQRTFSGI